MRPDAKTVTMTLMLSACMALGACGGKEKSSTAVVMNHMEVVDGTTTDAMTDLDGVQSESGAVALPANRSDNAAAPAQAPQKEKVEKPANAPAADTEVLSDQ